MIKCLIVIMFALAAHGVPASAASLSPFAHDGAGRPVLEFAPATAVKFSAQGRDLTSLTVKETPPENDARGATDLALIVDCRLRQLAASPIAEVAKEGTPPTTVAGFKTSDLKPPPRVCINDLSRPCATGSCWACKTCRQSADGSIFSKARSVGSISLAGASEQSASTGRRRCGSMNSAPRRHPIAGVSI